MNASIKNNHKEIPGNPSTPKENKFRLNDRSDNLPLRVLSESNWKFSKSQGYVVIKKAISKSQVEKTAAFLWEFEEKIPNDTFTWYQAPRTKMKMEELVNIGMVEFYNHQYL